MGGVFGGGSLSAALWKVEGNGFNPRGSCGKR